MKKLTYNEWQIYLILELQRDYRKLKLNKLKQTKK